MKDLTGRTFGRLTVISFHGHNKHGQIVWLCKCSCGNKKVIRGSGLTTGGTSSCGCLHRDVISKMKTTHGLSNSREYFIRSMIIQRCVNPKSIAYKNYGGRGIKICRRWLGPKGFVNFLNDLGRRPSRRHSVERIDNNGNYYPANCIWATRKRQNLNTRRNIWITHKGKRLTASQWAKRLGMTYSFFYQRFKRGMPVSELVLLKR